MEPELQTEYIREGEESIRIGRASLATDPRAGIFQITSGLGEIAWAYVDSDPDRSLQFLGQIVDTRLIAFSEHGLVPSPERQNDGFIFASAANQLGQARQLAEISVDTKDSHSFDIRLNSYLRGALGLEDPHGSVRYSPTKSEIALFRDLELLAIDPSSCTLDGFEQYWKASRNRRYKYTIYQKLNLFRMAGQNIKKASNHASAPDARRRADPKVGGYKYYWPDFVYLSEYFWRR